MLDVMHFLMEEDINPATREQFEAKSRFREAIYPQFYDQPYAVAGGKKSRQRELDQMPIDPPMGDDPSFPKPVPQGAPQAIPQAVPQPVPQPVGHPARPVTPGSRQTHAASEGRGMKHKPYIPPTDGNIVDDPFHPFRNLRETPLF